MDERTKDEKEHTAHIGEKKVPTFLFIYFNESTPLKKGRRYPFLEDTKEQFFSVPNK